MIRISKDGMPSKEMYVEKDTAEALLEALACMLGYSIDWKFPHKGEALARIGSVLVVDESQKRVIE